MTIAHSPRIFNSASSLLWQASLSRRTIASKPRPTFVTGTKIGIEMERRGLCRCKGMAEPTNLPAKIFNRCAPRTD